MEGKSRRGKTTVGETGNYRGWKQRGKTLAIKETPGMETKTKNNEKENKNKGGGGGIKLKKKMARS
jgi:hypothetical protein